MESDWYEVSKESRDWLDLLGGFSPTAHPQWREVKGFLADKGRPTSPPMSYDPLAKRLWKSLNG